MQQLQPTIREFDLPREPFLRLETFAGEQGQVDWAHFGHVQVGRARRALSCFVMTLSYSRALYLEFFFDQTTENFLRGHVHAFEAWGGAPRVVLPDFVPGHKIVVLWPSALCGPGCGKRGEWGVQPRVPPHNGLPSEHHDLRFGTSERRLSLCSNAISSNRQRSTASEEAG